MTFVQELAARILDVRYSALPPDTLHWARASILDTLGVALAGSVDASVRLLDRVTTAGESLGPCRIFGTNRYAAPQEAALINGMAGHAIDFDLANTVFAGHATPHLLSASFALGELLDADGRSFLTAYVAGFEAQSRIARGSQPEHSNKGWFPSSTIGVFGVAAAASHMLALTPEQTATALNIAASLASGLLNGGSMTKPLLAGTSARNGIFAALLARQNFTAPPDSFEGRYGFLSVFDIVQRFDPKAVLADWGRPFEICITPFGIKQHPCCGLFHAAVDVLAKLVTDHKLVAEEIERIDVSLFIDLLHYVDRPNPRDGLDAKFSAQYCLARTFLQGRPRMADFEGNAFLDENVRRLMARIHVSSPPHITADVPRTLQGRADLQLSTTDGRTFIGSQEKPAGRVSDPRITTPILEGKFVDCAKQVLSTQSTDLLVGIVRDIDSAPSIREISAMMVVASN